VRLFIGGIIRLLVQPQIRLCRPQPAQRLSGVTSPPTRIPPVSAQFGVAGGRQLAHLLERPGRIPNATTATPGSPDRPSRAAGWDPA